MSDLLYTLLTVNILLLLVLLLLSGEFIGTGS